MGTYTDEKGYKRYSNLVHRRKAYKEIYQKDPHSYSKPFSQYVVHHKDGNKKNNNVDNLAILTPEEHNEIHGIGNSSYQDLSHSNEGLIKDFVKETNFFQAEDGIRDYKVTGVQTCALPIFSEIKRLLKKGAPWITKI